MNKVSARPHVLFRAQSILFVFVLLVTTIFSSPAQITAKPVQADAEINSVAGKKVTLDAGHGWRSDSGAVGNGMKEKDVTLDIVFRTKTLLEQYGIIVHLTRSGDEPNFPLRTAAQRANSHGSDLNVSVHTNGGVNATGTESCYQVNHSRSSDSLRLAQLLTNEVSSQLGLRKRGDFPENDGGRCARRNVTGWNQLYIHNMNMPAVIIETAFINGQSQDVEALRNRRDVFARAIAHAVVRYLGGDPNNLDEAENRTLAFEQPMSGKINTGGDTDSYTFTGNAGQAVQIEMSRVDGNVDPFITLYRPDGGYLAYDDDSAGSTNARIKQILPQTGAYRLVAKSYATMQTGGYTVTVKNCTTCSEIDPRWLTNGVTLYGDIQPANDEDTYYINAVRGQVLDVIMNRSGSNGLDSYLELYGPNGDWVASNDDGGGNQNSRLLAGITISGVHRIKARSYNRATSGSYMIRAGFIQADNLSRNRQSYASSAELSRFGSSKAFDGRLDTRWSSQYRDPQSIYVDLGSPQQFDSVVLRWETAFARRYGIYVWENNAWRNVFWTNNGRGGTTNIQFAPVTSRYVMMHGVQRSTQWGYSLWEFEVFNASALIVPTVPPDSSEKTPDEIDHTAPLPLPEQLDDKDLLALYLGDGESAQEVIALPETEPVDVLPTLATGQEGLPTATITDVFSLLNGEEYLEHAEGMLLGTVLNFGGEAADTDFDGDPGIVAYEWVSSLDGLLSTEAGFSVAVSDLSSGEHTITFRAQDNEGNWSEWDSYMFSIPTFNKIFLPAVSRETFQITSTEEVESDAKLMDAGQWGVHQAAYVQSNFPNTSTNGQQNYYIGQDYLNGQWNKGSTRLYFQPQFSGLPSGAQISKAAIYIYLYARSCSNNFTVDTYEVTGSWVGNSLTWNNQPARGSRVGSMTMTCSAGWKEVVITDTFRRWNSGTANNGVLLMANPESIAGAAFRSHTCNTSQCPGQEHPYFRVEYTLPPTYTITGRLTEPSGTPVSGATVTISSGASVSTDGNGYYSFGGLAAGNYTITPSKSGFIFTPLSKSVTIPPNQDSINFTGGVPPTYSVSGKISDINGVGIPGVVVSTNSGANAISDANGNYTITGLTENAYQLTPTKTDYTFIPSSRAINLPPNQTGQNFTGEPKNVNDSWTMMIYMAGDNNLFHTLQSALERLEATPPNPKVRILVLFDNRNKNDTWRYHVQFNGQYVDNVNRWYLGEKNTGDPQTLQEFIQWGLTNYPADHTYLSIANHGRGTSGIAHDDNSNKDSLTPAELSAVLSAVTNSGQKKIDILHFDTCLMAMFENSYDLRTFVDYLVFSQNLGWSAFAYELYANASSPSSRIFATNIANLYFNHPRLSKHPRTISVVDLSKAQVVYDAIDAFANAMRSQMTNEKVYIQNARMVSQKFDSIDYYQITQDDEYLDLYHFADRMESYSQNAAIRTAAQNLKNAIQDGFVIYNRTFSATYGSGDLNYWDLSNAKGISVYFPPRPGSNLQGDYQRYIGHQSYAFTQTNPWDDFLKDYFGLLGLPPIIDPLAEVPPMLEPSKIVFLPFVKR